VESEIGVIIFQQKRSMEKKSETHLERTLKFVTFTR
jgi:hypothetical protein